METTLSPNRPFERELHGTKSKTASLKLKPNRPTLPPFASDGRRTTKSLDSSFGEDSNRVPPKYETSFTATPVYYLLRPEYI
jgi:hypothetical protein